LSIRRGNQPPSWVHTTRAGTAQMFGYASYTPFADTIRSNGPT